MAAPTLVRYFDLSGGVDADPLILQPPADALGPLTTELGGSVLFTAWEVDGEGRRITAPLVPTPGLALTIGVVTLSSVTTDQRPPAATATETLRQTFWARGPLSAAVSPGEWQIQAELEDPISFTVIVTAKASSPAGRWLAIYAQLQKPGQGL